MKILAIMGSPKGKGNGYRAVKKIESYIKVHEEVDFDYKFIKDLNIKMCKGCFLCVKKDEKMCPIDDDLDLLKEEIKSFDGIILSSPGYVSNVSGIMKNLIDRFAYLNHRPDYFAKKMLIIANGGSGLDKTIEALEHTFGGGPEVIDRIEYLSPPWDLKDKVSNEQDRKLKEIALKFYNTLENKELPKPTLSKYIRFRFFKQVSTEVKKYLPADYYYYKNKDNYYYDTKINIFYKIAAWFSLKIGFFMMKDMEAKE